MHAAQNMYYRRTLKSFPHTIALLMPVMGSPEQEIKQQAGLCVCSIVTHCRSDFQGWCGGCFVNLLLN